MLPTIHRQAYQNFLLALLALREIAASPQPEAGSLERGCQQVQTVFQTEIFPLSALPSEELEAGIVTRCQSIQTEIYRSLRLLATDFLFWRTSRQVATSQQRLTLLRNRLEGLIAYCQAAMETE